MKSVKAERGSEEEGREKKNITHNKTAATQKKKRKKKKECLWDIMTQLFLLNSGIVLQILSPTVPHESGPTYILRQV